MRIDKGKTFEVNLTDLKPNKKNPRKHKEKDILLLSDAIKRFKIVIPLIIDESYNILAGNARYEALKRLGVEKVLVVRYDHLSEVDIRAFILAENRLAERASWDESILKIELQFLIDNGFDMNLTGFEPAEIDMYVNDIVIDSSDEDELPLDSEVIDVVNPGDLFQLGKHKLYCGDSLIVKSYDYLLASEKVKMSISDCPYNVRIANNVTTKKHHKEFAQASGEMSKAEFTEFLRTVMLRQKEFSIDGSIHMEFMDWKHIEEIVNAGNSVFDELKNVCVWDKGSGGLGSCYRSQHEMCFVFKNGTAPHTNNIQLGKFGRNRSNIWSYQGMHVSNPEAAQLLAWHPTPKPLNLISDAILDFSEVGSIVLDSFGGSGTTILAAEKTQRIARVIEIDPHYCSVSIYRWEKMTGQKAVLLGNIGDTDNVREI